MNAMMPEWMTLIAALLLCLAAFSVLWVISLRKNDASIVDWYWGTGFGVIALFYAFVHGGSAPAWVLAILTVAWSVRLTAYMVRRHLWKGEEDARYAAMRAAGGPTYKRDSLFKIFWLQAVIMWMIATPQHAGLLYADGIDRPLAFFVGLLLFAAGFTLESVADSQLDRFIRTPGLGLIGFSLSGAAWTFIGPAILTFLLVKVSGVPMLDAHLSTRPGWSDYAANTPALLPIRLSRSVGPRASGDAIT
jgi:steroid 5-alpha reductase family enzyme